MEQRMEVQDWALVFSCNLHHLNTPDKIRAMWIWGTTSRSLPMTSIIVNPRGQCSIFFNSWWNEGWGQTLGPGHFWQPHSSWKPQYWNVMCCVVMFVSDLFHWSPLRMVKTAKLWLADSSWSQDSGLVSSDGRHYCEGMESHSNFFDL